MFSPHAITELQKVQHFVLAFIFFVVFATLATLCEYSWTILIFPIGLLVNYLALYSVKSLFNLFIFVVPLSIEWEFPNGLSTDIPGEALLWVLTILTFFRILQNGVPRKLISPIGAILLASLFWMAVCTAFSENQLNSLKSLLAKTWYLIPMVILPLFIYKSVEDWKTVLKCYIAGLVMASAYFFIKHFSMGLAFEARGFAGSPIWRNHVNYACALVIGLPIGVFLWRNSRQKWARKFYLLCTFLLLLFCFFSYARVAYLCIAAMTLGYVIIRMSVLKYVSIISMISIIAGVIYLNTANRYLSLAPVYEKAVTQTEFDHLIQATYQRKDISSMERVYRWVAGINMIVDKPIVGFGPASFYHTYQQYSVNSFKTYVSDNPDHSGIHNYYLMLATEQGLPGLIIFLWMLYLVLLKAQVLYHKTNHKVYKNLVMTAALVFIGVLVMNTINDMIEVIKVGIFFYLAIAIIMWVDSNESKQISKEC